MSCPYCAPDEPCALHIPGGTLMSNPVIHHEVAYWHTFQDARYFRDAARAAYPLARVVQYDHGYAVQREPSGPYLGPNPDPDRGSPGCYSFR